MPGKAKPIPDGFHTATPYMIIRDAARAIEFYKKAFGATEVYRHSDAGGKIRHAQIRIGDSPFMIADEFPEFSVCRSPQSLNGSPMHIYLYVEDVDPVFNQAVASGATTLMPVIDQFYATAAAVSPILSAIFGGSPLTRKTSPPTKSRSAPPPTVASNVGTPGQAL